TEPELPVAARAQSADAAPRKPAPAAAPPPAAPPATLPEEGLDLREHMAGIELQLIREALERTQGVVAHAAQLLGLRRTTLVEKMRKYGIDKEQGEPSG